MPSSRNWADPVARRRCRMRRLTFGARFLLAAAVACAACESKPAIEPPTPYRAFYTVPVAPAEARGTLKGDYQWAASSSTREDALARWREFLQKHGLPGGEYQDAFQRNYVRSAQYELMRLEYLAGHVDEGDALLRDLEDVRGR